MSGAAGAGDDHLQPALSALVGVVVEPLGRAVRGDHLGLVGTPSASSTAAASFSVGQSDRLPMMMPTTGLSSLMRNLWEAGGQAAESAGL